MAKKKSNSKKTPRTLKYAGAAPKSKYVNASINKWNAEKDEAVLKNKKIKNSHKAVAEKYSRAFHVCLTDDVVWDGGKTAPKPCCAPPAAPPAPSTGWRKWIGYVIGPINRFLNGVN